MSFLLPRLRMNLDFMPSPSPEHPGLFIRDPYHFSDAMLVIPPPLVQCLRCFDGGHTDLDLREALVRITGDLDVGKLEQHLVETLSAAGFLEDEQFARMEQARRQAFAEAPVREAAHAGSAYPEDAAEMQEQMNRWMANAVGKAAADGNLLGIAAPHVSPSGGWQSYRDAYRMIGDEHRNKTFVILATSHYGESETFGLTRKTFRTPLGDTRTDTPLVDWLEAHGGSGVRMEDYCHSFEHTVELQLIFLQHVLGPDIRILPVLVGSFAHSIYLGGNPEDDDKVKAFLNALGELREREGDRLFFVLGVDMAHMGARYQDEFTAIAGEGAMQEVESRDAARIARIEALDAAGFWDLVRDRQDDLKWCGSSPFYTFLKTGPKSKGELLRYEQWNIDERSVVSFAGMAFTKI
ncbi:MAG TPA: AmmeMemoRadiSam system protein B [Verrucomicrobiae bacterium]|nr:AmmeMemoRadiSam system protein B [Verrucomicrobiae bacterium]